MKKPVFVKSEGIPNGVYLRAGSNTRKASPEYIEELIRENKRSYFDEEPVRANTNILSEPLLKKIFKSFDNDRLITEKIITYSHSNLKKFVPTITGVLTFYDHPDQYIPEAIILCTRFHGTSGRDIVQSEEICGPLSTQAETSFELVRSWLVRNYSLIGIQLKGKSLVPEEVLREVIINTLVHRKYWIPGAIKIALYDIIFRVYLI